MISGGLIAVSAPVEEQTYSPLSGHGDLISAIFRGLVSSPQLEDVAVEASDRPQLWANIVVSAISDYLIEQKIGHELSDVAGGGKTITLSASPDGLTIATKQNKKISGISLASEGRTDFYPAPYVQTTGGFKYLSNDEERVLSRLATGVVRRINFLRKAKFDAFNQQTHQLICNAVPVIQGNGTACAAPMMAATVVNHELVGAVLNLTNPQGVFAAVLGMPELRKTLHFIATNPAAGQKRGHDAAVELVALALLAAGTTGRNRADVIKAARSLCARLETRMAESGGSHDLEPKPTYLNGNIGHNGSSGGGSPTLG